MSQFFTSGSQSIRVSVSASVLPLNISGLISFRIDQLDLLAVQGTHKSLLQHHSSKALILRCSAFFIVQLSHPYMTTGKTIALTRRTFVGKVMSLLFNMLPHKAPWKDLPRPKPTVSFQSFSNKIFFSITTVRHILVGKLLLLQLDSPINGSFSASFTGSPSPVRIVFPDPIWIFSISLLFPRSDVHSLRLFPTVRRCNDTHISLLNPDLFTLQPVYPNVIEWNTRHFRCTMLPSWLLPSLFLLLYFLWKPPISPSQKTWSCHLLVIE